MRRALIENLLCNLMIKIFLHFFFKLIYSFLVAGRLAQAWLEARMEFLASGNYTLALAWGNRSHSGCAGG